jgi:hypothetical protein
MHLFPKYVHVAQHPIFSAFPCCQFKTAKHSLPLVDFDFCRQPTRGKPQTTARRIPAQETTTEQ